MTEKSFLFDFKRSEDFFENFNIKFKITDMYNVKEYDENNQEYIYNTTSTPKFELVIVKYGGNNITDYLTTDGLLDESYIGTENIITQDIALDWYNRGNGECTIELHGDCTFNIGDNNIPLKAIFLRDKTTKYVMGYSINMNPFTVTNKVIFDDDLIFWDISRFNQ